MTVEAPSLWRPLGRCPLCLHLNSALVDMVYQFHAVYKKTGKILHTNAKRLRAKLVQSATAIVIHFTLQLCCTLNLNL